MALRKKGKYYYGDNQDDLALVLNDYAKSNKYPIDEISEVKCIGCGHQIFKLLSDDDGSGALCQCLNCSEKKFIRDSQQFISLEELDNCKCMCDDEDFAISVGLSFYQGTKDVRWVYVGAHCSKCGMLGNYIDWNER